MLVIAMMAAPAAYANGGGKKNAKHKDKTECSKDKCCNPKTCSKDAKCPPVRTCTGS